MTVSYLIRRDADTIIARDEDGEYEVRDGDALDMGGGIVVQVMGPSQIGGGSFKLGAAVLLGGMVLMVVAGIFGFGKGM